ncbi:MAG TPA: hypothetical protein VMG11_03160 [Steroidobacteraceae bacterium]|nr:hypothetical protein [Steroidobacteraceae bacterium]
MELVDLRELGSADTLLAVAPSDQAVVVAKVLLEIGAVRAHGPPYVCLAACDVRTTRRPRGVPRGFDRGGGRRAGYSVTIDLISRYSSNPCSAN